MVVLIVGDGSGAAWAGAVAGRRAEPASARTVAAVAIERIIVNSFDVLVGRLCLTYAHRRGMGRGS